ncbi:MAG: hypothetical protein A3F83_16285 [Candidatus Glassbacteria bacterium RIFCSPLOWO2_12_FULL_58_11]|uniref:CBM-cenC domain-containing protein n=1 Tax=Candidatus Glassbacteria bacterium RIFCSPLOWO2_12_FULL_58_11 TaxID=1817867 RepID=A0A1F5Z2B4_9BACT|nr:MAG: hypothetical protein A3F83_16285 [Candidatus Glassbacteria bacterium RIFCSPLOWO2_12_FULL_58_11]
MKSWTFCLLLLAALLSLSACSKPKIYPLRWVYASNNLSDDSQVAELDSIVRVAAAHGLNGLYLSSGFDAIDLKQPEYFERLARIKSICDSLGMEIIPRCLDVGYNGGVLAHNKNLAEGLPVEETLFVVKKGEARVVADPPVGIVNGGFEKVVKKEIPGFTFGGPLDEIVFVDKTVVQEGKTALRFENFGGKEDNPGRLFMEIAVQPRRQYRLSLWVRTEGLDEANPFGSGRFRVEVLGGGERPLSYYDPRVRTTQDWKQVVVGFNSKTYNSVKISIGVWRGKTGRFWVDDLRMEEIGLVNVLRRNGTPLTVRGEKSGITYEEGKDYDPVADPELSFRFNHDGPQITIPAGSRIKESERLRVSYYHGMTVYQSQVTACMSEPEVYEIWRKDVQLIKQHLAPKKYFVSVDEVRAGGTCQACQDRHLTMGQILADCIRKQEAIIHEIDPQAEIVIWSDMLDPNHNARPREGNYYYLVDDSFTGSWENLSKDLIIACWSFRMRRESLDHFSSLGCRTLACGYYDEDSLANDSLWLEALDATPGAQGIMYTTWLDKYGLLGEFGDMVSSHQVPEKPGQKL